MLESLKEYLRINAIQRLFSFVEVKKTEVLGLVLFSSLFALLEGIGVSLLLPILQYMEQGQSALTDGGGYWGIFLKGFNMLGIEPTFIALLVLAFVPTVLRNVVFYFNAWYSSFVSSDIMIRLRMKVVKAIYGTDPEFYSWYPVGQMVDVTMGQTAAAGAAVIGVINIFGILMLITVYLAVLLALSIPLTLSAVLFAALVAFINRFVLKRISTNSLDSAKESQKLMGKITERMEQMQLIKLRDTKDQETGYIHTVSEKMRQISIKIARISASVEVVVDPLMMLSVFVTLYIGTAVLGQTLAQMGLLLLVLMRLNAKVREFNAGLQGISISAAGVKIVQNMYTAALKADTIHSGDTEFKNLKEGIEIKGLEFCYPHFEDGVLGERTRGKRVLKDINATIPRGSFTALVGRSGAGKSTLVELLPRMKEASSGDILYDGTSIKSFQIGSLRRGIGYVTQTPMLFNDTIRENVTYGLGFKPTEEQIRDAFEKAHALFVYDLPEGLETMTGDRGVMFSGGERQRIALARVLLEDTDILVFDEPTSALDSESEGYIQRTLAELHGKKTLIVIAHRLATVVAADQLLVLKDGEIVERGAHSELIELDGVYKKLFESQLI